MNHNITFYIFIVLPVFIFAQQKTKKGQAITEYGQTYVVSNPDFKTDTQQDLKVVFDIGRRFGDSTKINPLINTAARYLNMHVAAGVPKEKLHVAMVIHGAAAYDILSNKEYTSKYKVDNPNTSLISALIEKGVQIILCGQTAAHYNISKKDILPDTQIALSAMTALVQLQNNDYRLINF